MPFRWNYLNGKKCAQKQEPEHLLYRLANGKFRYRACSADASLSADLGSAHCQAPRPQGISRHSAAHLAVREFAHPPGMRAPMKQA